MVDLFSCMADALHRSLAQSTPDCGAFSSLPWIRQILRCFEAAQASSVPVYRKPLKAIPLLGHKAVRPTFLRVLRLLQTSQERGLLTCSSAAAEFRQLLGMIGDSELPTLSEDLEWDLSPRERKQQYANAPTASVCLPHTVTRTDMAHVQPTVSVGESLNDRFPEPLRTWQGDPMAEAVVSEPSESNDRVSISVSPFPYQSLHHDLRRHN